jgi:hypothetical protein
MDSRLRRNMRSVVLIVSHVCQCLSNAENVSIVGCNAATKFKDRLDILLHFGSK